MTIFMRIPTTARLALIVLLGLDLTNNALGASFGFDEVPYTATMIIGPPHSSMPNEPAAFHLPQQIPIPDSFNNPGPYGQVNCLGDGMGFHVGDSMCDGGFIWVEGSYFTVDFGSRVRLDSIRLWSSAEGSSEQSMFRGDREMFMTISYGDTAATADANVPIGGNFLYDTNNGEGTLDDGTPVPCCVLDAGNYTGWYQYLFEETRARYWRLTADPVQLTHMPSTAEIQFGRVPEPSTTMLLGLGMLGLMGLRRRRLRRPAT